MPEKPGPDELLEMFRADQHNARLALFTGAELLAAGREEEAVAVWTLGDDADPHLRRIKDDDGEHPLAREHSAQADGAISRFLTDLHQRSLDAWEADGQGAAGRIRNAIWAMTHEREFAYRTPYQEPQVFYVPDLPALPVTPHEQLPWAENVEAYWSDIRDEFLSASREQSLTVPYVPTNIQMPAWRKLSGSLDWSAIYLFKDSRPIAAEKHFPVTHAALDKADLVRVNGVPMEAFFSSLQPTAHIPPHHGLTNARLTVHLPLIVPDDCAIRVGQDTYHWQEGSLLAFDDSFEHEAWNRSERDRTVLIFESHHPDLTPDERAAIEHVFATRSRWIARRTVLLGWHNW